MSHRQAELAKLRRHLGALMQKNLLLKRRHPCSFLCELFLAIGATGLLALTRTLTRDVKELEIPGELHVERSMPVRLPECAEYVSECSVRLVQDKNHSKTCVKGVTYGCKTDRRGTSGKPVVWVSLGCSGTFDTGPGTEQILCHSQKLGKPRLCRFDLPAHTMNLREVSRPGPGETHVFQPFGHEARTTGRRLGAFREDEQASIVGTLLSSGGQSDLRRLSAVFAVAPADGGGRDFVAWLNRTGHPWAASARLYDSAEAIDAHLAAPGYPVHDLGLNRSSTLCGALIFDSSPLDSEVRYTLRFNQSLAPDPNLPPISGMFMASKIKTGSLVDAESSDEEPVGFNPKGMVWYTQSGYLALQRTIDTFLGELARRARREAAGESPDDVFAAGWGGSTLLGEDGRPHVIVPFPTPTWKRDIFAMLMPHLLASFLMISLAYSVNRMITAVVHEREARLRDGMRMMGMHPTAFYLSWILTYLVVYMFVCVGVVLILTTGQVLPRTSPSLLLVWLLLFASASISYALVISTFFTKAKTAATVGSVAFFSSSYLSQLASPTSSVRFLRTLCLLPPVCFELAAKTIAHFESQGVGITWENLDLPWMNFSLFDGCAMLAIDGVVLLVLFLYLDQVAPREVGLQRPWYFPVQPSFWREALKGSSAGDATVPAGGAKDREDADVETPESSALVEQDIGEVAAMMARNGQTVELRKLSKVFKEVHAVKGLDLVMYSGEIFALLGHNGAGKTTTLAMLCGLMPPTRGRCVIYGHDLLQEPAQVQRLLGVCPQHDVLWEDLSCEEHLKLFAGFKGVPAAEVLDEVASMLERVGLKAAGAAATLAGNLSGGMKRKLSLGIAFLGGSRLVVLDEPTSGLDPYSRRMVWELLRAMKQGRVTVLSTHYMDEADILGDRIAILHEGSLRCCGSPHFLKRAYDCGYNVTFVKRPGCEVDLVFDAIGRHMPELCSEVSLLSDSGNELILQFPFAAARHFPKVLGGLEQQMSELHIESYGVSVTTLEEVFLKVASGERVERAAPPDGAAAASGTEDEGSAYIELQDAATPRGSSQGHRKPHFGRGGRQREVSSSRSMETTARRNSVGSCAPVRRCGSHLSALLLKRFRYGLRDRRGFLCQLCLPSGALVLLLTLMSTKLFHSQPVLELDARLYNQHSQSFPRNVVDYSHLASVKPEHAEDLLRPGKEFWSGDLRRFAPEKASPQDLKEESIMTSAIPSFVHMILQPAVHEVLLKRALPNVSAIKKNLAEAGADLVAGDDAKLEQDILQFQSELEKHAPDTRMALHEMGVELPEVRVEYPEGRGEEDVLRAGIPALREELQREGVLPGAAGAVGHGPSIGGFPDGTQQVTADELPPELLAQLPPEIQQGLRDGSMRLAGPPLGLIDRGVRPPPGFPRPSPFAGGGSPFTRGRSPLISGRRLNSGGVVNSGGSADEDLRLAAILEDWVLRAAHEVWSAVVRAHHVAETSPFAGALWSHLAPLASELSLGSDAGDGGVDAEADGGARRLSGPATWARSSCMGATQSEWMLWGLADKDHNGHITKDEAHEGLQRFMPKVNVSELAKSVMAKKGGAPELAEMDDSKAQAEVEQLLIEALFFATDRDGDGRLSQEEYCTVGKRVRDRMEKARSLVEHFSEQLLDNPASCSRYGAYYVMRGPRASDAPMWDPGADAAIFVNTTSSHAAPVFQAVLTNARFARLGYEKTVIPRIHPFPQTKNEQHNLERIAVFLLAIYITFCLSFIPAGIANFVVKERVSGSQQLQILSGASRLTFWLSNYIYDVLLYTVPALCVPACLSKFGFQMILAGDCGQALAAVLVVFGPAVAGFSYLVSFWFRDHSKASNAILTFCLVGASVLSTVLFILTIINYDPTYAFPSACDRPAPNFPNGNCAFPMARTAQKILGPLFRAVPTVCVYQALFSIALVANLRALVPEGAADALMSVLGENGPQLSTSPFAYEWAGEPIAYLAFEAVFFLVATILVDICLHSPRAQSLLDAAVFGDRASKMLKFRGRRAAMVAVEGASPPLISPGDAADAAAGGDSSVEVERERTALVMPQDAALHVKDLQKTYRRWSTPWVEPKCAVKGVSFCIHAGEVFGLLGHNGAGKTSVLKCLVGELNSTAGSIHVGGTSMEADAGKARRRIGYCPQFDALLELLTVRDHLELLAPLKGLSKDTVAEALIEFKLESMAHRRADLLSGGNKRKLSAALALVGSPTLAVLDEPSCGLDPSARRALWGAVHSAVAGATALPGIGLERGVAPSAVLLTTHSMEEAEALSTRLGIMAEGKLLTVGTSQQIKQRHGSCHELCLSLKPEAEQDLAAGLRQLGNGTLSASSQIGADSIGPLLEMEPAKKRAYSRARCVVRSQIEAVGHVEASVLVEWWLQQSRGEAIEQFLVGLVGDGVDLAENFGPFSRFRLPHGGRGLPQLFQELEENGPALGIAEYTLSQATLEQIFNGIAGDVDTERQAQQREMVALPS